MDLYLIAAIVMLVAWAIITFTTEAPGVVHLLLTAALTMIIWRTVKNGTKTKGGGSR